MEETSTTKNQFSEVILEKTAHEALFDAERKFRKACIQITLLNTTLQEMQQRYRRAKADNFKCFRYNLRLKLAVVEGVRNTYYDYAHIKAEQVAELRQQLFGEHVNIVTDSDTDDDEEEEIHV